MSMSRLSPSVRLVPPGRPAGSRWRAWVLAVSVLLHLLVLAALLTLSPRPDEDEGGPPAYELRFQGQDNAPPDAPGDQGRAPPQGAPDSTVTAPAPAPPPPPPPTAPEEVLPGPHIPETPVPPVPDAPPTPPATPVPQAPPVPDTTPPILPPPAPTPVPVAPAPPAPPAPAAQAAPPDAANPAPVPAPPAVITPEPATTPPPAQPPARLPEVRLELPAPEPPAPPLVPDLVLPAPPAPPRPTVTPTPRRVAPARPRPAAPPPPATGTFANPMDLNFGSAPTRLAAPRTTAPRGSVASRSLDLSPGMNHAQPNRSEAFFDIRAAKLGTDWQEALKTYWLRHRYYPRQAAEDNEDGSVDLELTVDGTGRVREAKVTSRSGSTWLDMAAASTWRNAQLPPLPPELGDRYVFSITINYILIR